MNFGKAGDACNCSWGRFIPFQSHPLTFSSSLEIVALGDSSEPSALFFRGHEWNIYTRVVKANAWKWLCGRCVSSSLNCFLGAGVSQRQQVSLWAHLPFSLTPVLSSPGCDLLPEEPRHTWASLEQGQSCHCLQQVCSLLSVFTQGSGDSTYCAAAYKMQIL